MKSLESSPIGAESAPTHEKLPKPVYYIESPTDDTVLIGIDVTIDREQSDTKTARISWYDTSHERVMTAKETAQKDDYFAFERVPEEGGGIYYFAPMNLDIYNQRVKSHLENGANYSNNDDLTNAFLATIKNEV